MKKNLLSKGFLAFTCFAFINTLNAQTNTVSYADGTILDLAISPGYSKTISFDYNFETADKIAFGLNIIDASGEYESTAASALLEGIVTPSGPNVGMLTVTIPNDIALSATLTNGRYYRWDLSALCCGVGGLNYVTGDNSQSAPVTVQSTLGINSVAINSSEMFVSNTSKSLNVNASNLKSDSARIVDMTGRVVASIKNLKQAASFDLSNLRNGVYSVVTNDNRKLKFAL
jgi:hypothetical protein